MVLTSHQLTKELTEKATTKAGLRVISCTFLNSYLSKSSKFFSTVFSAIPATSVKESMVSKSPFFSRYSIITWVFFSPIPFNEFAMVCASSFIKFYL
jgi:hypothetical protein